jgi:hypothetical protein
MKRYMLFAGDQFYPNTAWADFRGDFDSVEEARAIVDAAAKTDDYFDWHQIVDAETKQVVVAEGQVYGDLRPPQT